MVGIDGVLATFLAFRFGVLRSGGLDSIYPVG